MPHRAPAGNEVTGTLYYLAYQPPGARGRFEWLEKATDGAGAELRG